MLPALSTALKYVPLSKVLVIVTSPPDTLISSQFNLSEEYWIDDTLFKSLALIVVSFLYLPMIILGAVLSIFIAVLYA